VAGGWRSRRFFLLGLPILLAGLAAFVWEETQPTDLELVSTPLLLVGVFLVFEGVLAWRRERASRDNPK